MHQAQSANLAELPGSKQWPTTRHMRRAIRAPTGPLQGSNLTSNPATVLKHLDYEPFGQEATRSPEHQSPAHKPVGDGIGGRVGAERDTEDAAFSDDPAQFAQSQFRRRNGFERPCTGDDIKAAVFERDRFQPALRLQCRDISTVRQHGLGRIHERDATRRHTFGNERAGKGPGAASRIEQIRIWRGKHPDNSLQRRLCLAAGVPEPAAVKPVVVMGQVVIKTNPVRVRNGRHHLTAPTSCRPKFR